MGPDAGLEQRLRERYDDLVGTLARLYNDPTDVADRMVEVAAVHGSANASLVAGYGYTGILIAFIARQNPLAIIPVALMFGGIAASGGLLQRRLALPDATILVLQGIAFVMILASDTLYGRFRIFQPRG